MILHQSKRLVSTFADVIIAGGGMVGSATAAAVAKLDCMQNRKVILLEASPKKHYEQSPLYSNRVAALAPSSVKLLSDLGAWETIQDHRVSPVFQMRVWDSCSNSNIDFTNEVDSSSPLSYIVENDLTVKALTDVLDDCNNLEVMYEAKVQAYQLPSKDDEKVSKRNVVIDLESGETLETYLLVGADGFGSLVRHTMGSEFVGWDYNQMGVVATIEVERSGRDFKTAWQRFLPAGPVALLPLSENLSSLVWTVGKDQARDLVQMDSNIFVQKLNEALCGENEANALINKVTEGLQLIINSVTPSHQDGAITPPVVKNVSNRTAFPLGLGHSTRYVGPRVALVGDAAHRVHPLAGQGVNLGFGDVTSLADSVEGMLVDGAGLGNYSYLCQYETHRQRHNLVTMAGIDGLQKLFCTTSTPIALARAIGLTATNAVVPMKKIIMRHAS